MARGIAGLATIQPSVASITTAQLDFARHGLKTA
jgi:hypothetical protein